MYRERQAYPKPRGRRNQSLLLAAIFTVGTSIVAAPFLSLSNRPTEEPAPTATPTSTLPAQEIPTLLEPPTSSSLNPDISWIKQLADRYFSLDSELSKEMVGKYHRGGTLYRVDICSNKDGSPLTGIVKKPVNVRREPWVSGNPPVSELKPGTEISSVFRITESNWLKPFRNIWRGVADRTGNLRFIAGTYQGNTFVEMNLQEETCHSVEIESKYPRPQK